MRCVFVSLSPCSETKRKYDARRPVSTQRDRRKFSVDGAALRRGPRCARHRRYPCVFRARDRPLTRGRTGQRIYPCAAPSLSNGHRHVGGTVLLILEVSFGREARRGSTPLVKRRATRARNPRERRVPEERTRRRFDRRRASLPASSPRRPARPGGEGKFGPISHARARAPDRCPANNDSRFSRGSSFLATAMLLRRERIFPSARNARTLRAGEIARVTIRRRERRVTTGLGL